MSSSAAIFFQKSKSKQDEFRLIELVTAREKLVKSLEVVIRDVKEGRKAKDDTTIILQTLKLMTDVRNATIKLLLAISKWQEAFTKPIRPQLMDCDYIIEKVIKHIDFVNSSPIRKIFNFQILRGNALLLPYPKSDLSHTIKTGGTITAIENPSIGVSSQEIADAMRGFTTINEENIIRCYQFLINCIPDDIYENKLASLERWLIHPWIPDITVLTIPYNGVMNTLEMKRILAESQLDIDRNGVAERNNNDNKPPSMTRTDSQRRLRSFSYDSFEEPHSSDLSAHFISLKADDAKEQFAVDSSANDLGAIIGGHSNIKLTDASSSNSSHKPTIKNQRASHAKSNHSSHDSSPPLSMKSIPSRSRFDKFKSPINMKKSRRSNSNNSFSQIPIITDNIKLIEREEEHETEDDIVDSLEQIEELSKIEEIISNLKALTRSASPSHTLDAASVSIERINKSQRLAFLHDTNPITTNNTDPISAKTTTTAATATTAAPTVELKTQTQRAITTTTSILSSPLVAAASKRSSVSPMKSFSRNSRSIIAANKPRRSYASSFNGGEGSVVSGQGSTSAHYADMENRSVFSDVEEDVFSVSTDNRADRMVENKKNSQTIKSPTPGSSLKISSAMLRSIKWD
mmetsp:Transcript_11300/g.15541  ORF Transcript_11300/g.15541 Transcript_11300/m.15541 type:complete len:631 (+) Transcript_11300:55-1947(+)|eukprot:CAMPEP_0170100402 /NCGR_PEP_ID=MMETSP0020_2-20130122/1631_1 /TAXON_ID=98059 /ORGANISM="Dinobryon sp., Strain UTEXLB2267" /LENGTH=630 /DNA_ID=CAMNT_0010323279 /DNA_START=40 /DNA_END=1935 /DNA_ORIENTATION=-